MPNQFNFPYELKDETVVLDLWHSKWNIEEILPLFSVGIVSMSLLQILVWIALVLFLFKLWNVEGGIL